MSQPEPPTPAAASPVRRPGLAAPAAGAPAETPLLEAFSFVKERILVDEAGGRAPVYLVIGTAGAGKTTFLSMLGEILRLRETKYYFPHKGIDEGITTKTSKPLKYARARNVAQKPFFEQPVMRQNRCRIALPTIAHSGKSSRPARV